MTIFEAVTHSKTSPLMAKSSIRAAQKMLVSSETLLWAMISNVYRSPVHGTLNTQGFSKDMLAGVIAVTDQRILFVNSILGRCITKEIRLSDIRAMDLKSGEVYACLRIAGTSDMIVTTNSRQHVQAFKAAIDKALADQSTAAPATPAQPLDTAQLQALKQLYDSGVSTAEEFAAKKAQILGL